MMKSLKEVLLNLLPFRFVSKSESGRSEIKLSQLRTELTETQDALADCKKFNATIQRQAKSILQNMVTAYKKLKSDFVKLKDSSDQRIKELANNIEKQQAELSKYQCVIDAEAQAEEIRISSQRLLREASSQAKATAKSIETQARERADNMLKRCQKETNEIRSAASAIVKSAEGMAYEIRVNAEKDAMDVAGDAWDVKLEKDKNLKILESLKNQINGYGDKYIIPVHELLDDLAESVGYSEAGRKLKAARARSREVVRSGQAALCTAGEMDTREAAQKFVIDAFNAKVHEILRKAKSDNWGILKHKMLDEFRILNAFTETSMSTRITDPYLNACLKELQAACVAQELKKQEQEEQRLLRAKIREEKQARREYEEAIKKAEDEKKSMRQKEAELRSKMEKEMEDERQRLEKASLEERVQLEKEFAVIKAAQDQELATIRDQMAELEERGRRAISMAQKTKKGHVYVISNIGSFGEHIYKIGLTRRLEPEDRVKELSDSSVPFNFDIHALIESDNAPALEHKLHKHFAFQQVNKANHRREFFRCNLSNIRSVVDSLGLKVKWTMTAEATEYQETKEIEKRISQDEAAADRWLRRELILEDKEEQEDDMIASSL
jgi:hypothetical protein